MGQEPDPKLHENDEMIMLWWHCRGDDGSDAMGLKHPPIFFLVPRPASVQ